MKRPVDGWKMGRDSQTKLTVKFHDGNIRTFYSLDWKSKRSMYPDRELGLQRLQKLMDKWKGRVDWAHIEDNGNGKIIERYKDGRTIHRTT